MIKQITVKELEEYDALELFGINSISKIVDDLEQKNEEIKKRLGLRNKPLLLYKKNRRYYIKFSGIAGVLSFSNFEIEIMPKFFNYGVEWRESLFNIIYLTKSNRIQAQHSSRISRSRMNFYDHVALMYLDNLTNVLSQEPIHTYREVEDSSRFLKGRLLMYAQLAHLLTEPGKLYFEHDVFDTDNEFNYLINWCTQALILKVNSNDIRNKLRKIKDELPKCSQVYKIPVEAQLPPQYSHYIPVIEIANNMALGFSFSHQKNGTNGVGYIVPMEVIYEKFIEHILMTLKTGKYDIKSEPQSSLIFAKASDKDMNSYYTRPDNKIFINGEVKLLIDAKYKNNFINYKEKKPVNSDVYQLFASLVSHGCQKGILISPCESDTKMNSEHWTINNNGVDYTICSLMIDLSDMSSPKKIIELKSQILSFIEDEIAT